MRRAAVSAAVALAAVLLQLTVVNNLPWPGGSPPDLALVVVAALGLAAGPMSGALTGFGVGLALDIAPPASHLLGQDALVFCLLGYLCGWLRGPLERSSWLPLAGLAAGIAAGESLYALVGVVFADPSITWHSAQRVVPVSASYDLVLSPFVLYCVARLGGYWQDMARADPAGLAAKAAPLLGGLAGAGGVVRDTRSGRGPRLRADPSALTSSRRKPAGQAGAPSRAVKLKLSGGVAGSAARGPQAPRKPARPASPNLHLGAARHGGRPGSAARARGGAVAAAALRSGVGGAVTRPASSKRLRAAAFSHGHSALPRPAATRTALLHRGSPHRFGSRHRGLMGRATAAKSLAGGSRTGTSPGRMTSGRATLVRRGFSRVTLSLSSLGLSAPSFSGSGSSWGGAGARGGSRTAQRLPRRRTFSAPHYRATGRPARPPKLHLGTSASGLGSATKLLGRRPAAGLGGGGKLLGRRSAGGLSGPARPRFRRSSRGLGSLGGAASFRAAPRYRRSRRRVRLWPAGRRGPWRIGGSRMGGLL